MGEAQGQGALQVTVRVCWVTPGAQAAGVQAPRVQFGGAPLQDGVVVGVGKGFPFWPLLDGFQQRTDFELDLLVKVAISHETPVLSD